MRVHREVKLILNIIIYINDNNIIIYINKHYYLISIISDGDRVYLHIDQLQSISRTIDRDRVNLDIEIELSLCSRQQVDARRATERKDFGLVLKSE